jgi:hypothetical protein
LGDDEAVVFGRYVDLRDAVDAVAALERSFLEQLRG